MRDVDCSAFPVSPQAAVTSVVDDDASPILACAPYCVLPLHGQVTQMTFNDRMNAIAVTGEQMARANKVGAAMIRTAREAGRRPDLMTAVFGVMKEFSREITPAHVSAIMFRMQALGRLLEDHAADHYTVNIKGRSEVYIQEAVYEAAAKAKLDLDGDHPEFNREEFLDLVLGFTDTKGRG